MNKEELLNRLEEIQMHMNEVEQMLIKKSTGNKGLLEHNEKQEQQKQTIIRLEKEEEIKANDVRYGKVKVS